VHGLALDGRARQLSGRLDNVYAPAVSKATLMTTTLQPAFDTRAKLGAGLRKSTALAGLLVMAVACEDPVAMAPTGTDAGACDARGPDAADARAVDARAAADAGVDAMADAGAVDVGAADVGLADHGPAPDSGVDCQDHRDCLGYRRCEQFRCVDPGDSPLAGAVIVNEVLIDGTVDQDANGDGDIDATEDELLELVNVSTVAIDLAGFAIVETDHLSVPRHTFAAGSLLGPGDAIVIFGGGTPSAALEMTPHARFLVANAQDPAFSNGLNLDDRGDIVRLLDQELRVVFTFAYGDACAAGPCWPAESDRSLTRDPDLTGGFVAHDEAPGAAGAVLSPGTRLDGTSFGP